MKYILIIGLFSLIVLVSCNKNEKKKISDDLLNCCFKTNTYWVYIDSVNNNVDSVYVVDFNHFYEERYVTEYTTYVDEIFDFSTYSSPSSESAKFRIVNNIIFRKAPAPNAPTTIYADYDNFSNTNSGYVFERLDSAFIYDRYYYRVLKIVVNEDGTEDLNKSIYYSNSDYGVLRHEIYSDSVLLSCKILMRKNIIR